MKKPIKTKATKQPLPNPQRRTILVVNPAPKKGAKVVAGPLTKAKPKATTIKEKKIMATAKQLAARRRFAAAAKAGTFRKRRKKAAKATNPRPATTHRPRVAAKGSRFTLGPKSPYKGRVTTVNPKRRRRSRKHRNPIRAYRRRRHSRNPFGGKKLFGFLDGQMIVSFFLGFGGFLGGVKSLQYVAKIPGFGPSTDGTAGPLAKFRGLVYIAGSLFLIAKVKNRMVRDAAIGLGIAGAYDVISLNVPSLNIASLAGVDYSMVGYDPMLGSDVSASSLNNLNGVDATFLQEELLGVDASYIV